MGSGTQESLESTNWSGYIASGTTFTGIGGDWTVPAVAASAAPEYSSQWVGIDGVLSNDLIQTGTVEATSGGATSYSAWYELLPADSVTIDDPVAPGDDMDATIMEGSSPDTWTISIEDRTQNWTYTSPFTYSAQAQTAEWIEEAPTVNGAQSTLADFGSTTFSSLGLDGADTSAVGYTDVDLTDLSGAIIAYPTPLTAGGFSVLFGTPRPSVTFINPSSGSTAGGDIVTIDGSYLAGVTSVTFGGLESEGYLFAPDGSLLVITPAEGAGTVPVVITTPDGSSSAVAADAFTFVAPVAPATPPVTSPVTSPARHRRPTAIGWMAPTVGSSPLAQPSSTARRDRSSCSVRSSASSRRRTRVATGSTRPTAGSSHSGTPASTVPYRSWTASRRIGEAEQSRCADRGHGAFRRWRRLLHGGLRWRSLCLW